MIPMRWRSLKITHREKRRISLEDGWDAGDYASRRL